MRIVLLQEVVTGSYVQSARQKWLMFTPQSQCAISIRLNA